MQQGKHRGQELRNSSSHEWVPKELSSLVLFETVLAQAEGFYYLAKGEYVGTKAAIERGLSKEFLKKLEASEVSQVAVAGTDATVTIVQKMEAEAVAGQLEKKVVQDTTSDFLTIIPAQFQNEVAQIIEKYEIENVKEAFVVLKINEKMFQSRDNLLGTLGELSKDLKKINSNPRWKAFKYDPAHNNKVNLNSIQEALVGIAYEEQGLLQMPLKRADYMGAEFFDVLNQAWDVKRAISSNNGKYIFNAEKFLLSVKEEFINGERIVIDITQLEATDLPKLFLELQNKLTQEELSKTIIVHIRDSTKSLSSEALIKTLGANNGN